MVLFLVTSIAWADTCSAYGPPESVAELTSSPVRESSGLAQSRTRDGVWFTHNDKGDEPTIYAFDLNGKYIEAHDVKNASHFDWEDIAAAPCPDRGDCLYIGDIGDNDKSRAGIVVYVVREPEEGKSTKAIETWAGVYPDGPWDAETLMVHPCTGRVHVITKDGDGDSRIYRFPAFPGKETSTLEHVGTVHIDGLEQTARQVTGGDFDVDGDRVVIRTGNSIREWLVDPEAPNGHWNDPPTDISGAAEFQGEGITYSLDGGLVTTSEGDPMTIGVVPCEGTEPAEQECDYPFQGGCGGCNAAPKASMILPLAGLFRRRR